MHKEMEKNGVGVRKGTWTKEEDILLRKCIEKYGEGQWHQVPVRAGLNRCRKSCRLRWMNYLKPNLKRGYFTKDEFDLIVRLHKLLGNRWSLIAGRLPGRTANDVKNFWNTRIVKNSLAPPETCGPKTTQESNIIIKPRPRNLAIPKSQAAACPSAEVVKTDENLENEKPPSAASASSSSRYENPHNKQPSSLQEEPNDWTSEDVNAEEKKNETLSQPLWQEEVDECIQWWSNLLEITENGEGTPFSFSDDDLCGPASNHPNADRLSSSAFDVDLWGRSMEL